MDITTLGIDLAKFVFQLHGIDTNGVVVAQDRSVPPRPASENLHLCCRLPNSCDAAVRLVRPDIHASGGNSNSQRAAMRTQTTS